MRLLLILLLVHLVCAQGVATVLLPASQGSLYADQKARQVGDLLTIIIVENAQASQEAQTQSGKSGEISGGYNIFKFIPFVGNVKGETGSNAAGSTARGSSITARVTVQVVEVKENGNLLVEGSQTIRVNEEEQVITLRGLVRPQDISKDNTVLSNFLADAAIEYKGTGSFGGERQKPGLIPRFFGLFDWLF